MKLINFFKYATFALALGAMAVGCSDDDDNNGNKPDEEENGGNGGGEETTEDPTTVKFIITSSDLSKDLGSPAYMRVFTDITKTQNDVQIIGDANTTEAKDGFTQLAWNNETETFTGFIYARSSIVLERTPGFRNYKIDGDKLVEVSDRVNLASAFGNTGTFGKYSYAAQVSQPFVTRIERSGDAINNKDFDITAFREQYAIDGTMPAITEIVDRGNNELALTLYYENRDSAAVAFTDYDFNVKSVIYDARIGASYGAQRSVRYSQAAADDKGNIYVFSGQTNNDNHIGALRINKGEDKFDASYHFNIGQANGNYRFRRITHITGSYFMLECFPKAGAVQNPDASGKMAVVDMENQTFTWVTGLPEDVTAVSFNHPDTYAGKLYLPVAGPSGMNGGGGGGRPQGAASRADAVVVPTLYAIGTDGKATVVMTFKTNELLKGINFVK